MNGGPLQGLSALRSPSELTWLAAEAGNHLQLEGILGCSMGAELRGP